mgnify:FL=1|jgi:hypothetical protein
MSTKINAEQLANEQYPFPEDEPSWDTHLLQTGYERAIEDVAQPIADERDELRQVLKDASELIWKQGLRPIPATKGNMDIAMSYANEQGILLKSIDAVLAKYPKP